MLLLEELIIDSDGDMPIGSGIVAGFDDATLAQRNARLLDNRALQKVHERIKRLNARLALRKHLRLDICHMLLDARQAHE